MSLSWYKRKARLSSLIGANSGEDDEGVVLDQLMHGQTVIGKTAKTTQIDTLRFTDNDLDIVGTLEFGQFGVIDVVTCKIDGRLYVRKSTEKRFALKTRDQCSPQSERDILLKARKTDSHWAPHLLCAFQTPTHLNLVMDYIEGGTLWDVLESSPHDGKVLESDLRWWAPQIVGAINWCHSQSFVHRDIKPHNFVITNSAHIRLIDFGSAAPLLPPAADGSQAVPLEHCLVPCGTCDYISPEILQAHEEALVALEMEDDERWAKEHKPSGYGRETDWWSMGAMLYEMAYGVAPFFSREIRHTYAKIMDHHRSLRFDKSPISTELQDLLRRLLTSAELRLGRCDVKEIQDHPFFTAIDFEKLHLKSKTDDLHVPEFTYTTPVVSTAPAASNSPEESQSRAFAFSALFQSSPMTAPNSSSLLRGTPSHASHGSTRSILREQPIAAFIGFSWGPPKDAFDNVTFSSPSHRANLGTPRPLQHLFIPPTPFGQLPTGNVQSTPIGHRYPFTTPVRLNALSPFQTLPRASTVRRTIQRRAVSDREAMKQLVDCVGMSARKKVLESGRKPRTLLSTSHSGTLKGLRFDRSVAVVGEDGVSFRVEQGSQSHSESVLGASMLSTSSRSSAASTGMANGTNGNQSQSQSQGQSANGMTQEILVGELSSDLDSDVPPSPSPTPRPGSAMSILSRRSQTPTGSYFLRSGGQTNLRPGEGGKRSISPSVIESEHIRSARYEDKSSIAIAGEIMFSYEHLEQMEKRHKMLMGDIGVVEGRLDEVSSILQGAS